MSLLRDRRFALLVAGQAVNAIGTWCALVALWGFASFRFDAGATELAVLGLSWALPAVLLGPVVGVPIDRFGPRRVLIVADTAAAVVALAFLLAGSFPALIALGALEGVTRAFAEPAFNALAPRIVADHDLARANSILALAGKSAIALGPLLAALAIGALGFSGAFVVNAATYLVGVAVLVPFRIGPAPSAPARTRIRDEIVEGWRVVAARPELRSGLLLAASVYVIWGAFIVVEPIYVREVLHAGPTTFAFLQACFGVALFVTGLVIARLGERAVRWSLVCAAAIGSGVAAVAYVGTEALLVACLGLAAWGTVTACFLSPLQTLMQRAAPVEAHGRVFALDGMVHSAGDLVSLPVVGVLAGTVGVQVAGVALAALPIAGGVVVWRRMAAPDPRPAVEAAAA
jgi:MFS family permease